MSKSYAKSIFIFILSSGLAIFGLVMYLTKNIELAPMTVILSVAALLFGLGIVSTLKTRFFNQRMKKLIAPENRKYYPVGEFCLPNQAIIGEMIPKDVRQIKIAVEGHVYESEWYSLEELKEMGITEKTEIALYALKEHPEVYYLDLSDIKKLRREGPEQSKEEQ